MNRAEGTISAIAITESIDLNLKELNKRGVYHLTIRNRGNVTAMINGVDDIKPDETFYAEVPFAVVNQSFRIDFLQDSEDVPNPRLVLWYGTLSCQ